jgi:hypothetical protein
MRARAAGSWFGRTLSWRFQDTMVAIVFLLAGGGPVAHRRRREGVQ